MAEKKGLFTHLVNPAYTSQECSCCHHINAKNRETQELFKCTNCNLEKNADENAALTIKSRYLNLKLREKLNKDNVYLCSRPKLIHYKNIKNIVEEVYKNNGVVTELLPTKMINRLYTKEASSFMTR